jgi:SAM-dependent methyltransferase
LATIAARLEFRATDEGYVRLSQGYFSRLALSTAQRILAVGCGTGVEVRAVQPLTGPDTAIVGIDHSAALIDAARHHTADAGLAAGVTFEVGDAHDLPYADDDFDIVILHTLISHVDDPSQVLREARRVVRPSGVVAVFDGDYASLTFAYPDQDVAAAVEERLIQLIVANPRVMRDMPRLLHDAHLEVIEAEGTLYANIGRGAFWLSATESYGALLDRSGLLPHDVIEEWRAFQVRSAENNTFFGASNYYTYLTRATP